MPNNVVHFAVHADDLERARRFYRSVFGWQFQGHGSPDLSSFCLVKNEAGEDPVFALPFALTPTITAFNRLPYWCWCPACPISTCFFSKLGHVCSMTGSSLSRSEERRVGEECGWRWWG